MTESRLPRLRRALRRRATVLAATGAAVVLVGVGTTAAVAATPTPSSSSSASAPCAPRVGGLVRALHGSGTLRGDLTHLAKDGKAHEAADRAAIKRKALAGGYGREVGRVARIVAGSAAPKGPLATQLPASLRADLKTLRSEARGSDARRAEAATIWNKAVGGSYGATVQTKAKVAKARADKRCAAKAAAGSGS